LPTVLSVIATPRLGRGPASKWLGTGMTIAVSTDWRVALNALLCAIASMAALACLRALTAAARGAAAAAFASKRNVLRARRYADPGDGRT
jgi:hypothetical protein